MLLESGFLYIVAKNRSFFRHDFLILLSFYLNLGLYDLQRWRLTNLFSLIKPVRLAFTLGSHLRVPPQGPILASWVPLFRYARFFCYCYFITHIKWDVIISSSLRLLLKMWDRCQNRTEKSGFYKKVHINRAWCSCNLYIARNCTQDNVKYHPFQHEEKWLRWIVIEQVNYYFPLVFPERNCAGTLSKPLRKK